MAKIGDRFIGRIDPENVAGADVPVFEVVFTASGGYTVELQADGVSAIYTAATPGSGFIASASAKTVSGAVLAENQPLADVEAAPDLEAVSLKFTLSPA